MLQINKSEKQALGIATILAIVLGGYFLREYSGLLIVACITAFVFNPVYQYLAKRWKNPGKAAAVTLLATFVAVIIPVAFVSAVTVVQVNRVVELINVNIQNTDISVLMNDALDSINQLFVTVGIDYTLTIATVQSAFGSAAQNVANFILEGVSSSISSIAAFITTFIIYIYVFLSLLTKQDKLVATFHQLNPLGKDIGKLYLRRAGIMTKGMVRGQFIIAVVQGFTGAVILYLAGFHSTFFFFFMILTALSVIPLGGGIIVIPIGIVMLLLGNIWQGLLILGGHFLIVTNEDNILRPKLVPDEARLDPALTILSVFSGLAMFGFIGIVVGPVIMILLVTTIEVYMEVFRDVKRQTYTEKDKTPLLKKPFNALKRIAHRGK
jgi:predicted PurR-regulated permease PerM